MTIRGCRRGTPLRRRGGIDVDDRSLRVFLKSNHENMPNYQLTPDQIDTLVEFILSLKP